MMLNGLEFDVAGFICTAAIAAAHTALSTAGAAIATAPTSRAFSKGSTSHT
jgi:hypothetical protein